MKENKTRLNLEQLETRFVLSAVNPVRMPVLNDAKVALSEIVVTKDVSARPVENVTLVPRTVYVPMTAADFYGIWYRRNLP